MTQVWPDSGDGPVPTTVSVICRPDAVVVVMVRSDVCAVAEVGALKAMRLVSAEQRAKLFAPE